MDPENLDRRRRPALTAWRPFNYLSQMTAMTLAARRGAPGEVVHDAAGAATC